MPRTNRYQRRAAAERGDFASPLSRPPLLFETVRTTPAQLNQMLGLRASVSKPGKLRERWLALLADVEEADRAIAAWDYAGASAWTLITLADLGGRVANGLRSFLPARPFAVLEPDARFTLYLLRLVLLGVELRLEDPFVVATAASMATEAGRLADAEIKRRAERPDAQPALMLVRAALADHYGDRVPPRADREGARAAERLVERLRRPVLDQLPPGLRRALASREATGRTAPDAVVQAAVDAQVLRAPFDRFRGLEPFEALALGLDGKLDLPPQAVLGRLADAARKAGRHRGIEAELRERMAKKPGPPPGAGLLADFAAIMSAPSDPETEAQRQEAESRLTGVLDRIAGVPRFRRVLEAHQACGPAATQQQIAAHLGIGPRRLRTIYAEIRRFIAGL